MKNSNEKQYTKKHLLNTKEESNERSEGKNIMTYRKQRKNWQK